MRLGWKESEWSGIAQSGQRVFHNVEIGLDSPVVFRENVRKMLPGNPSDAEIDYAWNAMLVDFPPGIINYLINLKATYKLYLLSNTNELHLGRFREIFYISYGYEFDSLFVKTYYSHEIGYRKPDLAAYSCVLQDASLLPERTVFVDDLKVNTEAAKQLGIAGIAY